MGFFPQFFQAVIFSFLRCKEMDDHIPAIHDDPAEIWFSFHARIAGTILFGSFSCHISQSTQHPVGCTGAYNEIISKRCKLMYVQQSDLLAFFIHKGFNDFVSSFQVVQGLLLQLFHSF